MRRIKRTGSCLILIFAMMISGIYFEQIKADSYVKYTENQRGIQHLDTVGSIISLNGICTPEQLEGRDTTELMELNGNRNESRERRRMAAASLQKEVLFSISSFLSIITCDCLNRNHSGNAAIMRYLHRKDGAKDCSLQICI